MNELVALEEKLAFLEKEFNFVGVDADRQNLELRLELDHLRLEMRALKTFLSAVYPTFAEQYPQILAQTIQEFDPEVS